MKPGSRDIKYDVLIEGAELEELKKCSGAMAESFGLDRRIEKYQGKRPIGLYRWDIECLVMAIEWGINDLKVNPNKNAKEIAILEKLYARMKKLEDVAFDKFK
ncbi:MAG: hypothetical protein DRN71_01530 [Candidatus Nanohalarchaeota archaeon]|nr:MAG: hypothetical protein DRN71_01530 [Candidatus Nanohaloarchaeota archaeon]